MKSAEFTQDLNDIVANGLAENIRQVEDALLCRTVISSNAIAVSIAGFEHLFSRLQSMLERFAILSVTRLFEPDEEGCQSVSIPVALNYLRFHADYLEISDREVIFKKLINFGHDRKEFDGIPDPWITQLVRKEFADRLPHIKDSDSSDLARALYNLKCMRDVSASEADDQDDGRFEEAERNIKTLLIYARDYVETIGQGYVSADFEAGSTTVESELKQLFERIGIA